MSIPPAPASMFLTKRSCPGTSTKPIESRASIEMREADVDGNAAAFFFCEAVRVDTGERFDQRGLAVIDVSGGADDDVFHGMSAVLPSRDRKNMRKAHY